MQQHGLAGEYVWAGSVQQIADWVLTRGTVWVGSPWRTGMFYPDDQHFVHPVGPVVGGHEYLCHAVNVPERWFRFANSWGREFGDRGFFYMTWDNLDMLLSDWGDAAGVVQVKAPR